MQPAGLASVERAKATGMWEAIADVDDLVVPDDLAEALAAAPPAAAYFDACPPSTRRNILRWIARPRPLRRASGGSLSPCGTRGARCV
ncbi:MAG: YdeI/OmpD-associated family protein [Kineosporiaceae bacterium]